MRDRLFLIDGFFESANGSLLRLQRVRLSASKTFTHFLVMNTRITTIALVISAWAPAYAGWEEGLTAFENADYERAHVEFELLAAEDDERAQIKLGLIYTQGYGVPIDSAKGLAWYTRAGELGNSNAQLVLGLAYLHGEGTAVDASKAFDWMTLAARAGEKMAQWVLGTMYLRGDGVPVDPVSAYR